MLLDYPKTGHHRISTNLMSVLIRSTRTAATTWPINAKGRGVLSLGPRRRPARAEHSRLLRARQIGALSIPSTANWPQSTSTALYNSNTEVNSELVSSAAGSSTLFSGVSAGRGPYIQTGAGVSGLSYAYWVNKADARIQFWIDRGKDMSDVNNSLFRQLEAHRSDIEEVAGSELGWDPMPNARSAKIVRDLPGSPGYAADPEGWADQMPAMVEAMECFHRALDPFVRKLDYSME